LRDAPPEAAARDDEETDDAWDNFLRCEIRREVTPSRPWPTATANGDGLR